VSCGLRLRTGQLTHWAGASDSKQGRSEGTETRVCSRDCSRHRIGCSPYGNSLFLLYPLLLRGFSRWGNRGSGLAAGHVFLQH